MLKHSILLTTLFGFGTTFGKTYIENTQELRNHLCNKIIDKQLIKEYIDDLILGKNSQELLEVQNILLEKKNSMANQWKPFKTKDQFEFSEGLNSLFCFSGILAAFTGAEFYWLESLTDTVKWPEKLLLGGSLLATITGLRLFCLGNQREALEKYMIIKNILQHLQTKKDAQILDLCHGIHKFN